MEELKKCVICPHNCNVNRLEGKIGRCKCKDKIKLALVSTHNYEEPCISGNNGSGTIFFSNCNLNCMYCQNYEISQLGKGREISIEELANIFNEQQQRKVNNINLVTPTMYAFQIIEAIKIARKNGLSIPIIYNTNGYEKVETLKALDGYIDIYLPDLKYYSNELSKKYSKVDNYFDIATEAIKEMYRQVGKPVIKKGIMKRGVIVRHLVLPSHIEDSKKVIKYLFDNYGNNIYLSIMNQYTPVRRCKYLELNNTVSEEEYDEIIDYAYDLGVRKCFVQDKESQEESFIPVFKGDSVI